MRSGEITRPARRVVVYVVAADQRSIAVIRHVEGGRAVAIPPWTDA
jgi:hypothetical protein